MPNKQAFVPLATDELGKEIASIAKAGNKLNARIQVAAINAVYYTVAHGDINFCNKLVLAMNNGLRKNSLVAFMEKFGQVQWHKENKAFIYRKNASLTVESVENITERWFETVKAPEPVSMYDFETDVTKFIKRMEKAVIEKATIKHIELMDYIKSAVDQYHADQEGEASTDTEEETIFTVEDQQETAELLQAALSGQPVRQSMRRAA